MTTLPKTNTFSGLSLTLQTKPLPHILAVQSTSQTAIDTMIQLSTHSSVDMYNSNNTHIYKRERTSDSARSATATQCVEQLYRSPASPRFPADIPRRRPRMKLVTAHHRRAKYSANGNSAHKNSTTLKEQQRQGPSCVDFELASNHARSHLAGCAAKTMARTHDMQEFQDPDTNEVFGHLHDQRLTRSFDKGETLQSTTCGSMDSCAKKQEVMPSLNCDSDERPHSVAKQASKSDETHLIRLTLSIF